MTRTWFGLMRPVLLTMSVVMVCPAGAQVPMPPQLIPDRVSQIVVTPVVADTRVPREIKISGYWPGCVPVDAVLPGGGIVQQSTLTVRLVLPQTLVACPAAFLPYTVTVKYTPTLRGTNRILVLNIDGEYLGEGLIDTRAPDDQRPAFNITGSWFDPQSNGSGLTFVHSRVNDSAVFGTWYVYDATGKPRWYTIQNVEWKSQGRVMEGTLYQTSAVANCPPPFTACPVRFSVLTTVGRARLTITGDNSARVEALNSDGAVIFSSNVVRQEI